MEEGARLIRYLILVTTFIVFLFPTGTFAANECFCIAYIRSTYGIDVRGDAWTIKGNTPLINVDLDDVLLIGKDHGALVVGFEGEQQIGSTIVPKYIVIHDTNYVAPCTPSTRKIAYLDPKIRGVYRPV